MLWNWNAACVAWSPQTNRKLYHSDVPARCRHDQPESLSFKAPFVDGYTDHMHRFSRSYMRAVGMNTPSLASVLPAVLFSLCKYPIFKNLSLAYPTLINRDV